MRVNNSCYGYLNGHIKSIKRNLIYAGFHRNFTSPCRSGVIVVDKNNFGTTKALTVYQVLQSERINLSKANLKLAKNLYSKFNKRIVKSSKIVQNTFTYNNICRAFQNYEELYSLISNYTNSRLKLPLYQNLSNPNFLLIAHVSLKSKATGGIDDIPITNVTLASLISLGRELQKKQYKPKPTKCIFIPKANGKMRPLGIASSRDKIVQQVIKVVLEPLFDRAFLDSSHGFRRNRSCHTVLKAMYYKWRGVK